MERKNQKLRGIAAVLAGLGVTGALASCGGSRPGVTSQSQSSHIHRGGTVVVALPPLTPINWYFPIIALPYNSIYNVRVTHLMYKGLFHIGRKGTINYRRSIAEKITWNRSGTVYTVELNPKWHWSDGKPLTAEDVLFTWQVLKAATSPNAPAPWPFVGINSGGIPSLIKSVTAPNPHEVVVTLKQPTNQLWFLYHGLSDFAPLPAHVWNKFPSDPMQEIKYLGKNGDNPTFFKVVDGPFELSKVSPNVAWTFTPNPHYDGHTPYISRLVFAYETSDAAEFNALKTGTVDVGRLSYSLYGAREQLTHDRVVAQPQYDVYRTILSYKNPKVAPIFRQRVVREAMQMAVDQKGIINTLFHGQAAYGIGPVPAYPPTYLAPALNHPVYPYNPQRAKELLLQHGWHLDHGVMTNNKGQRLDFSLIYPSGSTTAQAEVQLLQRDWARIGVAIHLQSLPFASILHIHHQYSKWEILTGLAWNYSQPYPTGGGMYATGGGYNFFGYSNAKLDQLIAATHAPQPSAAAAQAALNAYQVFVAKHLPNLFMPVPDALRVTAQRVHGVLSTYNVITQLLSPQYWWTSKSQ